MAVLNDGGEGTVRAQLISGWTELDPATDKPIDCQATIEIMEGGLPAWRDCEVVP